MTTPTLLRPTDLKEVRDAVLDSAGTLSVTGAGTAAAWVKVQVSGKRVRKPWWRTTWRTTPSKSCGACAARNARSVWANLRPGSR